MRGAGDCSICSRKGVRHLVRGIYLCGKCDGGWWEILDYNERRKRK